MGKLTVKDVRFTLKHLSGNGVRPVYMWVLSYISTAFFAAFFVWAVIVGINEGFSTEESIIGVVVLAAILIAVICVMVFVKKRDAVIYNHIRDCLVDAVPVVAKVEYLVCKTSSYGNFLRVEFNLDGKKKTVISPPAWQEKEYSQPVDILRYTGKEILCYYSPKQNDVLFTAMSRPDSDDILSGEAKGWL